MCLCCRVGCVGVGVSVGYGVGLPQATGNHFATSDCASSLQCYTPRHRAALAFSMIAMALIYFALVIRDRPAVTSVSGRPYACRCSQPVRCR